MTFQNPFQKNVYGNQQQFSGQSTTNQFSNQSSNEPLWSTGNRGIPSNQISVLGNQDFVKKEGTFPVTKTTAFPLFEEEQFTQGINQRTIGKIRMNSVSAMDAYKDYSHEELRAIDYKLKKSGKTQSNLSNQFNSNVQNTFQNGQNDLSKYLQPTTGVNQITGSGSNNFFSGQTTTPSPFFQNSNNNQPNNTINGSFGKSNNFFSNTSTTSNNFSTQSTTLNAFQNTNSNNKPFFQTSNNNANTTNFMSNNNSNDFFNKPSGSVNFFNNNNTTTTNTGFFTNNSNTFTQQTGTTNPFSSNTKIPFISNSNQVNPSTFPSTTTPGFFPTNNAFSSGVKVPSTQFTTNNGSNPFQGNSGNFFQNQSFNTNINSGAVSFGGNRFPTNTISTTGFFNNTNHHTTTNTGNFFVNNTNNSNIDLMNKTSSINFLTNDPTKIEYNKNVYAQPDNDIYGILALTKKSKQGNVEQSNKNIIEGGQRIKFEIPDIYKEEKPNIKIILPTTVSINFPSSFNERVVENQTHNNQQNGNGSISNNLLFFSKEKIPFSQTENVKFRGKENIVQTDLHNQPKKRIFIPPIKQIETASKRMCVTERKAFANECLTILNEVFNKESHKRNDEDHDLNVYKLDNKIERNAIFLNFSVEESMIREKRIKLKVSVHFTIGKLKELLADYLSEKMNFIIEPHEITIISKHSSVKDYDIIKDKEFFNSNENLILVFSDSFTARYEGILSEKHSHGTAEIFSRDRFDQTINIHSEISIVKEDSNQIFHKIEEVGSEQEMESSQLDKKNVIDNYYPILTKPGYITSPSYEELTSYRKSDLEQVLNFIISNDFGKIEFPGFTDLTYVNLDEAVNIEYKSISVYQQVELPPEGQKLNKPAEITFFKYHISDDIKDSDIKYSMFVNYINEQCRKLNAVLKRLEVNEGVLAIGVKNFCQQLGAQ